MSYEASTLVLQRNNKLFINNNYLETRPISNWIRYRIHQRSLIHLFPQIFEFF
jgi:hypothetical protein